MQAYVKCEKGAHYFICEIKIPLSGSDFFQVFLMGLELFFRIGMHLSSGDDEMFQWCWIHSSAGAKTFNMFQAWHRIQPVPSNTTHRFFKHHSFTASPVQCFNSY